MPAASTSFIVIVDLASCGAASTLLGQALLLLSHRFHALQFASPALPAVYPRCAMLATTHAATVAFVASSEGTRSSSCSFAQLRSQALAAAASAVFQPPGSPLDAAAAPRRAGGLFAAVLKAACFAARGGRGDGDDASSSNSGGRGNSSAEVWVLRMGADAAVGPTTNALAPDDDLAASLALVACVHANLTVHVCDPSGPDCCAGRLHRLSVATGGRFYSQFCEDMMNVTGARSSLVVNKSTAQLSYAVCPVDAAAGASAFYALCSRCFSLHPADTAGACGCNGS
jgi:hypothetical protein